MNPKRIIFVTTSLAIGGADRQVADLAIRLAEMGHRILVISMLPAEEHIDRLVSANVILSSLDMRRRRPNLRAVLRFLRIVSAFHPSLIHSHMFHANIISRLARLLVRVPCLVCTMHSAEEGSRWRDVIYRLTDSLADITTSVSIGAARARIEAGAVPRDRLIMVPNGIMVEQFSLKPAIRSKVRSRLGIRDGFLWVSLGRFVEAKGYDVMLEAFEIVNGRLPNQHLVALGRGPLATDFDSAVAEKELSGHVRRLDPVSDVRPYLWAADAYLSTSRWEGLPLAIIEAGASGLPSVSTRVGGVTEVIPDASTGVLVMQNDPSRIAHAMMILASDPNAAREMGRRHQAFIKRRFNIDTVVREWLRVYELHLGAGGIVNSH